MEKQIEELKREVRDIKQDQKEIKKWAEVSARLLREILNEIRRKTSQASTGIKEEE